MAVFSPDSLLVATASADSDARLWDSITGSLKVVLKGHKDSVSSVAFSNDGKRILTASKDGSAKIWNVSTGEAVRTLEWETKEGRKNEVSDSVFSPDGRLVAIACSDNIVRLWDLDGGQPVDLNVGTGHINHVSFSPNGDDLIAACEDQTIEFGTSATSKAWPFLEDRKVSDLRVLQP